jgi:predicted PurR-regulated permease PerM
VVSASGAEQPTVYSSFYRRAFGLVTALILGYLLLKMLQPLAGPLGWAAVLAFMLHPVHEKLTRQLGERATLSAGLLTGLTPFFVLAPLSYLAVDFTAQAAALITYLRTRTTLLPYSELIERMGHLPVLGTIVAWVRANAGISAEQVQGWVSDSVQTVLHGAAAMGGSLVYGLFGTVVSFFVMLFLLFFFLRQGRGILTHLTRLIPIEPGTRAHMLDYLGDVIRAVVFGSSATALICGTFVGVGYAVLGLPSPLVFGVLGVIAALLPAGAAVLLVPPAIYLLIEGRWGAALFLGVWTAIMWVVESVVRPVLTAHRADVSTLAVFIGAIGGVSAFGIFGLVIGPVLLSFTVALILFAESLVSRRLPRPAGPRHTWPSPPPARAPLPGSQPVGPSPQSEALPDSARHEPPAQVSEP